MSLDCAFCPATDFPSRRHRGMHEKHRHGPLSAEHRRIRSAEAARQRRLEGIGRTAGASESERFWGFVDRSAGPDGCWLWTGHKRQGYGRFGMHSVQRPAHVVAWELTTGQPFPSGMNGLHHCDNPPCVNPAHIYPGDQSDNMRDAWDRGRRSIGDTCPAGHGREWMRGEPGRRGRWCELCVRGRARPERAS